MSVQKCSKFIRQRVKGLDDKDALAVARRIMGDNEQDLPASVLRERVEKLTNEYVHILRVEKLNAKRNAVSRAAMYRRLKNFDDLSAGIDAITLGIQAGVEGGRRHITGLAEAAENKAHAAFHSDLEKDSLLDRVRGSLFDTEKNRQLSRETIIAAHRLDRGESVADLNPDAVALSRVLQKHNEAARVSANKYGANIGKREGYAASQSHSRDKIASAGFEKWIEDISPRLDWELTMPDIQTNAGRREALLKMYSSFKSGKHLSLSEPDMTGVKGAGNIGKSMSEARVLHFATPEDAADYNAKYGYGSVLDGAVGHIRLMARKTAVMKEWGPNARANWDRVTDVLLDELRAKDPDGFDRAVHMRDKIVRTAWPVIDGSSNVPGNHILAKAGSMFRASQMWSKLGMATLSAISDPAFMGAEVSRQGGSFLGGVAEGLTGVFGKITDDKKQILAELGVAVDGMTAATRIDMHSDATPGVISKATAAFFKMNGLTQWTDKMRVSFALGMSHRMSLNHGKAHADMAPDMQRILSLYEIGEAEWGVISSAPIRDVDGRTYLTAEAVREVDDATIVKYLEGKRVKASPSAIEKARDDISENLSLAYSDRATHAVLEPDTKTRAMLLQGTQAGTPGGEGMRSLMLFKSFSAVVLQKALGADFFGRGTATTWKGAARNFMSSGAFPAIAKTMLTSTALGYVAMSLKDMAKGKKPRDPMGPGVWTASLLQGGGLGIYGDFIFGDMKNRMGGGPLSTLSGPVLGQFSDFVDLWQRFRDGNDTAASAMRLLVSNTPGANLPYTKLPLDMLFMWDLQERLNPGYAKRMEARILKNNQQEYLSPFRPTNIVR